MYIQNFPEPGGKRQVSTDGGVQPRWRRDGRELYYIANDRMLMAVPIRAGSTLEIGRPEVLFETHTVAGVSRSPSLRQQYDVSPDGQRFLLNVPSEETTSPITVVLNWTAGLKQ